MAAASPETRVDPDGWDPVVAAVDGPQLVVAGPGAGKTEFLVRRALHLIQARGVAPEHLLLLSFSRRGAADLRTRVTAGLARPFTAIPASTFHSFALRLVEAYAARLPGWKTAPSLLTGPEQVALVARLLTDEAPGHWPVSLRGLLPTQTLAREVADFVLRCQEHLVNSEDLAARAGERADWRALPGFLERYQAALVAEQRIDYGTLQATALELLDDPEVRDQVAARSRYLLVDEYQDTTVAQARLLQRLYLPHRNLTVAGDPYQSVYSFRGAALANVADFPRSFPDAAGHPARRIVLTTSFRVPSEILDAAVRVTSGAGLPGEAGPVVPAPGRGTVEVYTFRQQTQEAEWIAAEAQRIHLRERLPYHRMAVMVRSTRRFLPELSRALERRGIPHEEPDRRLVDHPAVQVVLDCVRMAVGQGRQQTAALRRLLLGAPVGLTLSAARELEREQVRTGASWVEVIRRGLPEAEAIADLVSDPSWARERPAVQGLWHLWSTLPHVPELVRSPYRKEERAAWSSLSQVLGRLNDRNPRATLADYLRWSEEEDFEATPLLEYHAPEEDRLTLASLHQAKGVEFDVVFVADAIERVFPDLRSRESLLGVRHLSRFLPTDDPTYRQFRLQEESRLAYTAMCRARRRVVWTCTPGEFEQGLGPPSRFLVTVAAVESTDALGPPAEATEPSTPLEAEAWLRRMLADPGEPAPRRLAALSALVDPASWGGRPSTEFLGTLRRGPDTGLIPPDLALSPSQAESYLQCPRRYVFERRLRLADQGSVYLSFGSLIHTVLEAVEGAALAVGLTHGTLDDALDALDRIWDPAPFGGGEWAMAWHRRGEELLRRLYEQWPSRGQVVAVEHDLALEIGGTRWRGRADRIEARPGGPARICVIDYKTGRTVPSVAEAATSLQLGFYILAVAPELGETAAAEMWFPASRAKKITIRRFDPECASAVLELMSAAAAGIRAEDWTPVRDDETCRRCAVRLVCPEWPEGREAFTREAYTK